ncbi:MAG: ROK family transcriptional regulator, partial [Rhizobiaceae bacterium]|nr:ROK family transcriptional regulator [Rhizobiaceae bacterium]
MANSVDRDGALPGTNLVQTRTLNRRAVFDAVRRSGPITRTELAQTIGLTVQAISNIASELEVAGLIRQQGKRVGQRGQPAVELSLDPEGGYTIGLSLAYRRVSGVLVDLTGEVVVSESRELIEREPYMIAEVLGSLANRLLKTSDVPREKIWGIGCSVPGTVENGTFWYDKVQEADEWTKFPLAAKLEELTSLRAF